MMFLPFRKRWSISARDFNRGSKLKSGMIAPPVYFCLLTLVMYCSKDIVMDGALGIGA
jgi:hypothetical protein